MSRTKIPQFTAEHALDRHQRYGGLSMYEYDVENAVHPAQGCPWWVMSFCGPLIWDCGWICAPARAAGRAACLSCMRTCITTHTWWAGTTCVPCAASFC